MCTGKPILDGEKVVDVAWDKPTPINENDFFIVPNGVVHSLVAGEKRLRFTFGCPDAHLDDDIDKVVLAEFMPPAY
jgi:mannose-6-phosphate isomerase-like protein (cupin superfamily)